MEIPRILNHERSKVKRTITIKDKTPQVVGESSKICLICSENRADYCCPRCYKPYCSLKCYQNHGTQCTEQFYRDHVGKVLSLESNENSSKVNNENHQGDTLALEENPLGDMTSDELEELVAKIRASDTSSLSPLEKEHLSKVNRMMSHIHHAWIPFWQDEHGTMGDICLLPLSSGVGKVDIERISHLKVEFTNLRAILVTSNQLKPHQTSLCYQLIGALLGYVVMMRSTSGGWRGDHVNSVDHEKEHEDMDSPLTSLQLLLQSTPLINRSFRPLSVSQTVSDWMTYSSQSLPTPTRHPDGPGRRSQAIKALLFDVCQIFTHRELLFYCLFDMWLLGYISSLILNDSSLHSSTIRQLSSLACYPPPSHVPLTETILPHFRDNSFVPSRSRGDAAQHSIFLYTKKLSFLFSDFLIRSYDPHESVDSWRQNLVLELQTYINEYL